MTIFDPFSALHLIWFPFFFHITIGFLVSSFILKLHPELSQCKTLYQGKPHGHMTYATPRLSCFKRALCVVEYSAILHRSHTLHSLPWTYLICNPTHKLPMCSRLYFLNANYLLPSLKQDKHLVTPGSWQISGSQFGPHNSSHRWLAHSDDYMGVLVFFFHE